MFSCACELCVILKQYPIPVHRSTNSSNSSYRCGTNMNGCTCYSWLTQVKLDLLENVLSLILWINCMASYMTN